MDGRRKTRRIVPVAILLGVWIVGQSVVSVVRHVNDQRSRQRAEAWWYQAQQDAKPDMTKDDAVRWLRQHGADKVLQGYKTWTDGVVRDDYDIIGYRKLGETSFWTNGMTAVLKFRFDEQWKFVNTELEILPYEVN
jgi:hypothetical protein